MNAKQQHRNNRGSAARLSAFVRSVIGHSFQVSTRSDDFVPASAQLSAGIPQ